MKRIVAIVLLMAVAVGLVACSQKEERPLREEDIRAICELATLECYYNNVAKIDKEAENFLQKDRKMWIEYEGKATIGIKMSDVEISISGDTVTIKMPNAEVLSTDYTFKEDAYIVSSDGFIWPNKISTEDQQAGVVKGQEEMLSAINENKALFLKAEDKARELIENYINKIGAASGKEYTIEWSK